MDQLPIWRRVRPLSDVVASHAVVDAIGTTIRATIYAHTQTAELSGMRWAHPRRAGRARGVTTPRREHAEKG
jgi:hypothetical protein